MKHIPAFILVLITLIQAAAAQECANPSSGMQIFQNTILCQGEYFIDAPITLISSNIILQCNNTIITGPQIGNAIHLKERTGITIKSCNISGFENGIYLDSSQNNIIQDNTISTTKNAIVLFNSRENILKENIFHDNTRDIFNFTSQREDEEEPEQAILDLKVEQDVTAQYEEIRLQLSQYFRETEQHVQVTREFIYNETEDSTTIRLIITPGKTVFNYSYYEKIPKCVSRFVKDIVFRDSSFKVIMDDPLIMWNFAVLDSEKDISYKIYHQLSSECRVLLEGFGVATGFEEKHPPAAEEKSPKPISPEVFYAIVATIVIILVVFYIKKIEGMIKKI